MVSNPFNCRRSWGRNLQSCHVLVNLSRMRYSLIVCNTSQSDCMGFFSAGNRNIHQVVNAGRNIWRGYGNDSKFYCFDIWNMCINLESTYLQKWITQLKTDLKWKMLHCSIFTKQWNNTVLDNIFNHRRSCSRFVKWLC